MSNNTGMEFAKAQISRRELLISTGSIIFAPLGAEGCAPPSYLTVVEDHTLQSDIYTNGIFNRLPQEDKLFEQEKIIGAAQDYIAGLNVPDKDKALEEIIKRVIGYEGKIKEIFDLLAYPKDHPFRKISLGIILVESSGITDAESSDQGKGLFQLTKETPYDALKIMQHDPTIKPENLSVLEGRIKYETDAQGNAVIVNHRKLLELFNSDTNIILGGEYLAYLYSFLPEDSLAIWAFNFGLGTIRDMVLAYTNKRDHINRASLPLTTDNHTYGTHSLVESDKSLNHATLLQSSLIKLQFGLATKNKAASIYPSKVAMGILFIEEYKKRNGLNETTNN